MIQLNEGEATTTLYGLVGLNTYFPHSNPPFTINCESQCSPSAVPYVSAQIKFEART
jgi:hypothetical protein